MKYNKPYYDTGNYRPEPPLKMVEVGLDIFQKIFEKELKDMETWKLQPSFSQLIMDRCAWLFWNEKQVIEIKRRARPYIALAEESYRKDPKMTILIFNEIMLSYIDIQHSAFSREAKPKKDDDYVKKFNMLFDEYRFRYEELLNRLISFAHACIGIVVNEPPVDGAECINMDANVKLKRLNASILPSAFSYENISSSIYGIKPGIRNALSHGGRRTQLSDEKKFLLQDSSGWKKEYSLDEFHDELDTLNKTITSLEFATLVMQMNHTKEISILRENLPHEFTEEEKNQVVFTSAKDCQFDILEAESKSPYLEIKLRFNPIQPRESKIFGNWGGSYFSEEIPAAPIEIKGQVFRFIHFIEVIMEKESPGVSIEVYTWGEKLLVKVEIKDVKGFLAATKDIKGDDDYETKRLIESKFVKWNRFAWATGEIKDDGTPVQDDQKI